MKILLALFRYHYWGGLQSDTLRLVEEALARKHEVVAFTTSWPDPPKGLQLDLIPQHGLTNASRMAAFERAWQIRLAQGDYDVSIAMSRIAGGDFYFASDTCMWTRYHKKYPKWLLWLNPRHRYILNTERRIFAPGISTRIFTIAPLQQKEFQEAYGTPSERLIALPPGMRPDCMRPSEHAAIAIRSEVRKELKLDNDSIVFIQVASNPVGKGTDRLLKAMGALPREIISRLRLVLVGANDEYAVHKMALRMGFPPSQIRVTGIRKDVNRLLLGADAMTHPAREEGAGSVLVEALAAGIPVICSGICGFAPIVAESGGIVLEEPYTEEELVLELGELVAKLPDYTRKALIYGATHDFTGRARVLVDHLEAHAAE